MGQGLLLSYILSITPSHSPSFPSIVTYHAKVKRTQIKGLQSSSPSPSRCCTTVVNAFSVHRNACSTPLGPTAENTHCQIRISGIRKEMLCEKKRVKTFRISVLKLLELSSSQAVQAAGRKLWSMVTSHSILPPPLHRPASSFHNNPASVIHRRSFLRILLPQFP